MFTLAACVHLIGCTFYGIFASGELQPWAEPPPEEQQVWAPPAGAITHGDDPSQAGMMGNYMKETSFVSQTRYALGTLNILFSLSFSAGRTGVHGAEPNAAIECH